MDPSQQQMHHHMARTLMHLNHLASFFPFFQPNTDRLHRLPVQTPCLLHDISTPSFPCQIPRHQLPLQLMEAYTSSIRVLNPEPHIRAISYPTRTEEMAPPSSMIHRPDGTGTIHPGNAFHVRSRASSASTSQRTISASPVTLQQASSSAHPDVR